MAERRPVLTDPEVLEALAHPVRLDLLTYLMANGPASEQYVVEAENVSASEPAGGMTLACRCTPDAAGRDARRPWSSSRTWSSTT